MSLPRAEVAYPVCSTGSLMICCPWDCYPFLIVRPCDHVPCQNSNSESAVSLHRGCIHRGFHRLGIAVRSHLPVLELRCQQSADSHKCGVSSLGCETARKQHICRHLRRKIRFSHFWSADANIHSNHQPNGPDQHKRVTRGWFKNQYYGDRGHCPVFRLPGFQFGP